MFDLDADTITNTDTLINLKHVWYICLMQYLVFSDCAAFEGLVDLFNCSNVLWIESLDFDPQELGLNLLDNENAALSSSNKTLHESDFGDNVSENSEMIP